MNKDLKIVHTPSNLKLWSFLADVLSVTIASIALFYIVFYAIVIPFSPYNENETTYRNKMEEYGLTLGDDEDYHTYEEAIQHFYFDYFPQEIVDDYSVRYNIPSLTIAHIYNINVLYLPVTPTVDNYGNDYFEYVQNEDGTFNVDVVAKQVEGSGPNYERNITDIFYNTYSNLPSMLSSYDSIFHHALYDNAFYSGITRVSVFAGSLMIFYIIIPLTNKYGSTLFEKIFKIAHINNKTGFIAPKYKIVLRPIIYFIIPTVGVYFFSLYAMVIFAITPIFISLVMMLFSKTNRDLVERILVLDTAQIDQSLLFKNQAEENVYERSEEYQTVEDPSYLNRLDNTKAIDLSTSNDQKISKEVKKDLK